MATGRTWSPARVVFLAWSTALGTLAVFAAARGELGDFAEAEALLMRSIEVLSREGAASELFLEQARARLDRLYANQPKQGA